MTIIPKPVQEYIDIVESGIFRTCSEQKLLVAHIKKVFNEELLIYDEEKKKFVMLYRAAGNDKRHQIVFYILAEVVLVIGFGICGIKRIRA